MPMRLRVVVLAAVGMLCAVHAVGVHAALISHWKLDEVSGNALDSIGTNHGTLGAGITQGAAGQIGSAYAFSGIGSVTVLDDVSLKPSTFTISAWVNTTDTGDFRGVVDKLSSGIGGYILDSTGWSGARGPRFMANGNFVHILGPQINDGQWHMMTGTYDGITDVMTFYLDGALVGTASTPLSHSTEPFNIGGDNISTLYINGTIDDVGLWDEVLSAERVEEIYNFGLQGQDLTTLPPPQPTLRLWDGGVGDWTDETWNGGGPPPISIDVAMIDTSSPTVVTVTGAQTARDVLVNDGRMHLAGTMQADVHVSAPGMISADGSGTVDGQLANAGDHAITTVATMTVTRTADINGAKMVVTDGYSQTRGTTTGSFTLLTASSGVSGTFTTPAASGAASHLGRGHFLGEVSYGSNDVVVNLLAAQLGDADGDQDVDITDFNTLSGNFDPSGVNSSTNDWVHGDFDLDADVDVTDFNALSANFAPAGYDAAAVVPEPSAVGIMLLAGLCILVAGRALSSRATLEASP